MRTMSSPSPVSMRSVIPLGSELTLTVSFPPRAKMMTSLEMSPTDRVKEPLPLEAMVSSSRCR